MNRRSFIRNLFGVAAVAVAAPVATLKRVATAPAADVFVTEIFLEYNFICLNRRRNVVFFKE